MEADYKSPRKKHSVEQKKKITLVWNKKKFSKNQKQNDYFWNNTSGTGAIQLDSSQEKKVKKNTEGIHQNLSNSSLKGEASTVQNVEVEMLNQGNIENGVLGLHADSVEEKTECENNNDLQKEEEAYADKGNPLSSDLKCPVLDITNSQENDSVAQISDTSQVATVNDESNSSNCSDKADNDLSSHVTKEPISNDLSEEYKSDTSSDVTIGGSESNCLLGEDNSDTTSHVTKEGNDFVTNISSDKSNSDVTSHVSIDGKDEVSKCLSGKANSDVIECIESVALSGKTQRETEVENTNAKSSSENLDGVNSERTKDHIGHDDTDNSIKNSDIQEGAFKTVIIKVEGNEMKGDRKVNNAALAIIREVVKQKLKQRANNPKKNGSLNLFKGGKLGKNKTAKQKNFRSNNSKKTKRTEIWDSDTDTEKIENGSDIENNKILKKVGGFFVCKYCPRKFQWVGPYTKHLAQHRENEFDCHECGKKFTNHRNLMAHKYNRQKEREFICETCKFKTTTYCLLRKHCKEKHPSEIYFQCHICPKILKSKSYLNSHLKHCHNINDGKYECNICGHIAKRPTLLEKHMKIHDETDSAFGRDELECVDCGKVFKSMLHLRSHSRIHMDRKFLCDICAKSFSTKTKLRTHRMTHTGEKPYKCGSCDYSSAQRGNLRLHMKTHEREYKLTLEKRPYKCQKCDYTVNRITYFLQHMKSHDKDKRDAETELEKQMEREVDRIAKEERAKRKMAARESVDTQIYAQEQSVDQQDLGGSAKERPAETIDNANYPNYSEQDYDTNLFYRAAATKANINKTASPKKPRRKRRKQILPGKDTAASLDIELVPSENKADSTSTGIRTDFPNDINSDPALWTQEYFRTYMADQYRTGYQETAPHLMYLNQQRYYDAYSGLYESGASKQTEAAEEHYLDTKYSNVTATKASTTEERTYNSAATAAKQQDLNINLFSSSTGQLLRQLFGATQDIYSDSSVSNSYATKQQYQDTVGAYDMSYSGMYMHHADSLMSENANNDTQKYTDYTSNVNAKSDLHVSRPESNYSAHDFVKSDSSRPDSNYSTHVFDPYTAHAHDFSSAIPEIPTDQLMQFNRKEEESLYQTAATDLSLSEAASSVFASTEQEYCYEDLEQPAPMSGKNMK